MVTNKIAIGFVLYNPPITSLERIINYANKEYTIYVYVNSINKDELKILNSHKLLNVFSGDSNGGLSKGLTTICNAAYNSKFKALLYFDQDTIFESITLEYISSYYDYILKTNDHFCKSIVCTTFRDLPHYSRLNHISSHKYSNFIIENCYFTINSGSLYFLDKINAYKWFEERYFVDGVDYSFCINSLNNKFKITEIYQTPGIDHESEQGDISVRFFHKQINGRIYPFERNIDFVQSHIKLLFSTFGLKSIKPLVIVVKSLSVYLFKQVLFRTKTRN